MAVRRRLLLALLVALTLPACALRLPNGGKPPPQPGKGRLGAKPKAAMPDPPPRARLSERVSEALESLREGPLGQGASAVVSAFNAPVTVPAYVAGATATVFAGIAGLGLLVASEINSPSEVEKYALLYADVLRTVESGYVQPVDTATLFERGTNAMLHSLDPFTEFENSAARADLDLFTSGSYGGVGLGISRDPYIPGAVLVRDAREGYAFDAGLRVGDHLLSIDGTPVAGGTLDSASASLRGAPGSTVTVAYSRDGDSAGQPSRVAVLQRQRVNVPAVSLAATSPLGEGSLCGYIKLSAFTATAADEMQAAIAQLQASAAAKDRSLDALVLDLRGNSGGLLNAALQVAQDLLPHGAPLVTTQGRDAASRVTYVSGGGPLLPASTRVAVLVDERTASASEIVAGALQDLDRGLIVGTRSYGKGLVQSVLPLPFNTELKVTVAKYYTPSGRCIQRLGYAGTDGKLSPAAILDAKANRITATQSSPVVAANPALDNKLTPEGGAAPSGAAGAAAEPLPAAEADENRGALFTSNGGRLLPDSARKTYRTLHGRGVRDGGGIESDVQLSSMRPGNVERQLAEHDVFFAYAAHLAQTGKLAAPEVDGAAAASFKVEGRTLADFEDFAKGRLAELRIELESPLESALDALSASFSEEEGLPKGALEVQLPALKTAREQARAQLTSALRGSERGAIERRIAQAVDARSAGSSALLSRALRADPQLEAAIDVLRDATVYQTAFNFKSELVGRPAGVQARGGASADALAREAAPPPPSRRGAVARAEGSGGADGAVRDASSVARDALAYHAPSEAPGALEGPVLRC